jgi:hypothetical protein
MNWISSLSSKRTQLALVVIVPALVEIVQALMARAPLPMNAIYIVLGAGGFWSVSDSIRPTVKPADAADFAQLQKILDDLQANLKKANEVAK